MLARGIRNNNPGNLVLTNIPWKGKVPNAKNTDRKFEQFTSMHFGIRAMMRDLINDITKGKNTVRKLITEYAPPSENDTLKYIQDVSKSIGISADAKITTINEKFMILLSKAVIKKENGKDAVHITESQIKSAFRNLGKISSTVLKVESAPVQSIIPLLLFFFSVLALSL